MGNKCLTLCDTILNLNNHEKEAFCKHCGKWSKFLQPSFSPFLAIFPALSKTIIDIRSTISFVVFKNFGFGEKNLLFGKGLLNPFPHNESF